MGVFSYISKAKKGLKAIKRLHLEGKKTEKACKSGFQEKLNDFVQKSLKRLSVLENKTIEYIKHNRAKILLNFFRKDSAVSVVFVAATLVTVGNVDFKMEQSNFSLFSPSDGKVSAEELTQKRALNYVSQKGSLTASPLAMATVSEEDLVPTGINLDENQMQFQVLTAVEPPDAKKLLSQGADVSVYEVKQGDTLSTIASDFGITTKTILWANDMDDPDMIQPGDRIFILPTTGVRHIVKSGDSLKKIAKKYEADEQRIIAFNELPADGTIKDGDELIIPGGKIEDPEPTPSGLLQERNYYSSGVAQDSSRAPSMIDRNPKGGHRFPYGYCTWYVASKKYVPWGGNAGTWLYNAKAHGAKTGKSPKKGSIIVTTESWYGHVGIVTDVKGDKVTITEMNYRGFGVVSSRTISAKNKVIMGYIY